MKGTKKRSLDQEEDKKLKQELYLLLKITYIYHERQMLKKLTYT